MTNSNNPLTDKFKSAIPGETFRLPSLAAIYDEDSGILNPSVFNENKKGEVLVNPMRLKEELLMKSPDAIFQGNAVSEAIKYCVPDVLQPEKLAQQDVDYLLMCIKKVTYGDTYTYTIPCLQVEQDAKDDVTTAQKDFEGENQYKSTNIEDKQEDPEDGEEIVEEIGERTCDFNISLGGIINKSRTVDEDLLEEHKIVPFRGFEVETKFLSFEDFRQISIKDIDNVDAIKSEDFEKYVDSLNQYSNQSILCRIQSVDGIDDREYILEWIELMDIEKRSELFKLLSNEKVDNWGVDQNYTINCKKCGLSKDISASMNPIYFFLS